VVQARLINLRPERLINQLQVMGIGKRAYLSIPTLGVGFINLVLAGLLIISGSLGSRHLHEPRVLLYNIITGFRLINPQVAVLLIRGIAWESSGLHTFQFPHIMCTVG